MIDTADASTQWSERYDRPYKDLFVLQDEITRAVALKTLIDEDANSEAYYIAEVYAPRFAAFCKKVGLPTPAEVGKRT